MSDGNATPDRLTALALELAQERRARQALVASSILLNSLLNLPDLLHAIVGAAIELLDAESGALMLLDEGTFELVFEVATGETGPSIKGLRMPADQGIAGWALTHEEPVLINNVAADPRFYRGIDDTSGFMTRSLLAIPLKIRETAIGVVEVMNKRQEGGFTPRDQELALALAAQAAVAIDNARLYQKLADALVASRMSFRL